MGSNKADYKKQLITLADRYGRNVLQFLFVCCCPEVFCSKRGNFLQDRRPLCHSTEMATKDIYPKYSHQTNVNQIQMFRRYLTIQHMPNCVLCGVFSVPIILIIFLKSSYNSVEKGFFLLCSSHFLACWRSQNHQHFTLSSFVSTFHFSSSVLLPTCESWLPCPSPKGRQKVKQMAEQI